MAKIKDSITVGWYIVNDRFFSSYFNVKDGTTVIKKWTHDGLTDIDEQAGAYPTTFTTQLTQSDSLIVPKDIDEDKFLKKLEGTKDDFITAYKHTIVDMLSEEFSDKLKEKKEENKKRKIGMHGIGRTPSHIDWSKFIRDRTRTTIPQVTYTTSSSTTTGSKTGTSTGSR